MKVPIGIVELLMYNLVWRYLELLTPGLEARGLT